ncbi:MAG: hypothetical protein D4R74_08525 [Betaproteobacteria bacterium]|nr:MAG: hypothetical protein D4R74_08525 [Betaproteobacteria bacterium]
MSLEAKYVFILGTVPFILLGAIHIIYTLMDIRAPRKLTPYDDSVRVSMQESTLALTKQTTMWRAWVGFNISHGIGVLFFGLIYLTLALSDFTLLSKITLLPYLAFAVSVSYFVLSVKYWFHIPAIGSGIGAACFLVSLFLV